jgi:hypothetical protein
MTVVLWLRIGFTRRVIHNHRAEILPWCRSAGTWKVPDAAEKECMPRTHFWEAL